LALNAPVEAKSHAACGVRNAAPKFPAAPSNFSPLASDFRHLPLLTEHSTPTIIPNANGNAPSAIRRPPSAVQHPTSPPNQRPLKSKHPSATR
jgi:hypothetical protein